MRTRVDIASQYFLKLALSPNPLPLEDRDENLPPDAEAFYLLVKALNQGDPHYYNKDDPSTHPYFSKDIETISFVVLEQMIDFLSKILAQETRRLHSMRNQLPLLPDPLIVEEERRPEVRRLQTKVQRLQHLLSELEEQNQKRLILFMNRCASNLNLDEEGLNTLAASYSKNLLTALSGAWQKQKPPEA